MRDSESYLTAVQDLKVIVWFSTFWKNQVYIYTISKLNSPVIYMFAVSIASIKNGFWDKHEEFYDKNL